jgi:sugar phosphate isomerase/epimerase
MTRRNFIGTVLAAGLCSRNAIAGARKKNLHIGVTDWNLKLGANPDALPLAAQLGFDGIQVSFGRMIRDDKMPVDNPEVISRYIALSKEFKIPIDGTCVDKLNENGLKSGPLAQKWVLDSIRLTKALGTKVLLLPFFGRGVLQTQQDIENVADSLRDLGPEASKAGVILGLENSLSAESNMRIMERSQSEAVRVYYDVGNSTAAGFDPAKEIHLLGKDRICQFHFKDNPHYLGEGPIQFAPILRAIREIGFSGFANLETDSHPGQLETDMRRNLNYIRNLSAQS